MMEYFKLLSGVVLLAIFTWLLIKNARRIGFIHTLLRIDTIAGVIAGIYLIVTSVQ